MGILLGEYHISNRLLVVLVSIGGSSTLSTMLDLACINRLYQYRSRASCFRLLAGPAACLLTTLMEMKKEEKLRKQSMVRRD